MRNLTNNDLLHNSYYTRLCVSHINANHLCRQFKLNEPFIILTRLINNFTWAKVKIYRNVIEPEFFN